MPKVKLASQRLNPSGSAGQLAPSYVNPSGGFVSTSQGRITARAAAPSVNVNAGNVRYTPLKPNDIVVDNSLNAAAKMADIWVDNAFKFQQRQDKADADQMILAYNDMLMKEETGYTDQDGNWVDGYLYKQKNEATNGFDSHRGRINSEFQQLLESVPENVRQYAVNPMTNARNRALGRAAEHNVRQFKAVEAENLYKENRQILDNIKAHGPAAFEDGTISDHLMKYDTQEQRDEAAHYLSRYAIYEAYNRVLRESISEESPEGNPLAAAQAAESVFESTKPHLNQQHLNELDHYLLGKKQSALIHSKKVAEKELNASRKIFDKDMPAKLNDSADAANWEAFFNELQNYREMYGGDDSADPAGIVQSQKVVGAVTGAIKQHALTSGLVTVEQKHQAAIERYNQIMEFNGADNFREDELNQIQTYVLSDLRKEFSDAQKAADTTSSGRMAASVAKAENEGKLMRYQPPPSGMTEVNRAKWDAAQQKHAEDFAEGVDVSRVITRENTAKIYEAMQLDGPLTQDQLDDVFEMVGTGDLSMRDYAQIVATNEEIQGPGRKKPSYQTTSEYASIQDFIKEAEKAGIFNGGVEEKEVKDEPEEYRVWKFNQDVRVSDAKLALERAARGAAMRKQPFDAMEWWNNYQINVINKGRKTSSGFWSFLPLVP